MCTRVIRPITGDQYSPCVCTWSQAMIDSMFSRAVGPERICFHDQTLVTLRNAPLLAATRCRQCGETVKATDLQVVIADIPDVRLDGTVLFMGHVYKDGRVVS